MRNLALALSVAALVCLGAPASAGAEDEGDDLVRLPGQSYPGPTRRGAKANGHVPERLVAGGGLIVSFDANLDGNVTPEELATGIEIWIGAPVSTNSTRFSPASPQTTPRIPASFTWPT